MTNEIFTIRTHSEFNVLALKIFRYQYLNNPIYQQYVDFHVKDIASVSSYLEIPFLPIEFFKTHKVYSENHPIKKIFTSSGTSGENTSKHYIADTSLYKKSFLSGFNHFYGPPESYIILALLPSYLEREGSSLVYMAEKLVKLSGNQDSGFYLNNLPDLAKMLLKTKGQKTILLGVSFALLDLSLQYELDLPGLIVMETGGMKGRAKEITRYELHQTICEKLGVPSVHSEYGMTELLSQAYSKGNGVFNTPPWMKVLIRDINDPKTLLNNTKSGGINIIDLANIYSCSFIATQDLGKLNEDGSFEVLGRFDSSDIRGCNLLINE
ncbi:MAG: acyltransferase [Bacteroidales bacterium]